MNYYIKLDSGLPVGDPISEINLLEILEVQTLTESVLSENNYAKCYIAELPTIDLPWADVVETEWNVSESGVWQKGFEVVQKTDPDVIASEMEDYKSHLKSLAALFRFSKEITGIDFNDNLVRTDRQSQAQIANAHSAINNGLITELNWKVDSSNWIILQSAEVQQLAQEVVNHVDRCFKAEKEVVNAIDALTTLDEIVAFNALEEINNAYSVL